jgi:hypothetical protein
VLKVLKVPRGADGAGAKSADGAKGAGAKGAHGAGALTRTFAAPVLAASVMLASGAACVAVPGSGPPAERCALSRELTAADLSGFHVSFTPALAGEYAVTLRFNEPIEVEEIRDLVDGAAANVGIAGSASAFDFTWHVSEADRTLARGAGRRGATGTIDRGSEGLGGGTLKSRALAFGAFRAEAHRTYVLNFKAGPAMAPVIRSAPILEIMFQPPFPR